METALLDLAIVTELFFGPREHRWSAVTGWLLQLIVQPGRILGQEMLFKVRTTLIADLLKHLSTEAALGVVAQDGIIVECIQTPARRIICSLDGLLRFTINDAD